MRIGRRSDLTSAAAGTAGFGWPSVASGFSSGT